MQADPTIVYVLEKAHKYDGNIRREDLSIVSPYNIYWYPGLPPGPIAAASLAALEAAAAPANVPYLYFVSRNDGTHVYASTLEEHNRNVRQYQVQYFRDKRRRNESDRPRAPERDCRDCRRHLRRGGERARPASQAPDRARMLIPMSEFQEHAPPVSASGSSSKGPITLEMQRAWAPLGADRFYTLVRAGFYEDPHLPIRAGLWAQFGINGTPAIAQRWRNRAILMTRGRCRTCAARSPMPSKIRTVARRSLINLRDNSSTTTRALRPIREVIDGMAGRCKYWIMAKPRWRIRAGKQDPVFEGAPPDPEFPKLDYIKRAATRRDLDRSLHRSPTSTSCLRSRNRFASLARTRRSGRSALESRSHRRLSA
jgi:hypothetical protein